MVAAPDEFLLASACFWFFFTCFHLLHMTIKLTLPLISFYWLQLTFVFSFASFHLLFAFCFVCVKLVCLILGLVLFAFQVTLGLTLSRVPRWIYRS